MKGKEKRNIPNVSVGPVNLKRSFSEFGSRKKKLKLNLKEGSNIYFPPVVFGCHAVVVTLCQASQGMMGREAGSSALHLQTLAAISQ